MPELLGGLYSFGNRAKRQLRDLLSNPAAYLEQSAEKLRDEAGRPTSARQVAERTFNPSEADIERASAWWNPSPLGAIAGVVKQKGGNWLAGSVEDALRGLKRSDPTVGRWIEGPLTKYVKTRMASPEDEVRRLAEQGVLHFEPGMQPGAAWLKNRQVLGQSELAKNWEALSDQVPWEASYSAHMPDRAYDKPQEWLRKVGGDFAEANPEALALKWNTGKTPNDLGFQPLIDELSNALNPASGLPRHLQLTPEAMQNLSMEKAVRRVHDINEWRAAQQAELNRQVAEQASLVREYPENNPKGLRWVELKAGDLPKGLTEGKDLIIRGPEGPVGFSHSVNDPRRQALADQLKYEGDVMQNCVGGKRYCEGVLAGRTRIFSLRDAKGEPHVTVEVQPSGAHEAVMDAYPDMKIGSNKYKQAIEDYNERYPEEAIPKIIQIKGKGNRAPNKKYLPFVQDFVRNSPLGSQWSDVGDLENTGLLANKLHPSGFITREELEAAAKTPPEGYAPEDFIWPERYASGGRVTPITIRPGTETATTGTRGRSWDILSE